MVSDTQSLNVSFKTMYQTGDNERSISTTNSVSVGEISNTLFGTWSVTFNYSTKVTNQMTLTPENSHLTGVDAHATTWNIPSEVQDETGEAATITEIGAGVLTAYQTVKVVTVPASVHAIDSNAFAGGKVNGVTVARSKGSITGAPWGTSGDVTWSDGVEEFACKHLHTTLKNVKQKTCTQDGYTGDKWCTDCNTEITKCSVITATGHIDANYDDICDVCSEKIILQPGAYDANNKKLASWDELIKYVWGGY